MIDEKRHGAVVDAWLARAPRGATSLALLELFEAGFKTIWKVTLTTLGELTLTAIADRVVQSSTLRYPVLSGLALDPSGGLDCAALRNRCSSDAKISVAELREAIQHVMIAMLTVLGHLTAEILTEELHSKLSRTRAPRERR